MKRKEFRIYGSGGQGVITLGHLIGSAALLDGCEVAMTEEYSPQITGGWSSADLVISDEEIDYPLVRNPDYLLALSQEGFDSNIARMRKGSAVLVDSELVDSSDAPGNGKPGEMSHAIIMGVSARKIAVSLGTPNSGNVAMFGFLSRISGIPTKKSCMESIKKRFPKRAEENVKAFEKGYDAGGKFE